MESLMSVYCLAFALMVIRDFGIHEEAFGLRLAQVDEPERWNRAS